MQLDCRLWRIDHHFGDKRQGRLDFLVRRLEHQFVVDGEQHPRAQTRLCQSVVHADHCAANDVRGRALQRRVDGGALVEGALRRIGGVDARIVALAAE